jgi:hypothetical protein
LAMNAFSSAIGEAFVCKFHSQKIDHFC